MAAAALPSLHVFFVAVLVFGVLAALIVGAVGGWTFRTVTPLILTSVLAIFVVFSTMVLEFRWKEMRFVLPLAAMLIGIAGGWTIPAAIRMALRFFRLRRSAATER